VFYQGTSMACPHVAGVAALMLAVEPTLTPDEIEQFLEDTALDLGSAGHDNIFGHGLVQADAAVIAALGSTSTTPVLVTSPSTLNFGDSATFLVIGVTNAGGGALDVTGATFAFVSGPQAFAPTAIDLIAGGTGTNVSSIEVTVDRTGLAIGDYAGTITVASSNGGSRDVAVQMQVEVPPNPLDVDLFVVLVDPETLDVVRAVQVNPTVALDFDIDFAVTLDGTPVPINPGSYLLLCGSDDNNNNFIFDSGDIYTGGWPTLNDVQLITVDGDDVLTGLDFVVAPEQSTFAPAARFPRG
jgi:serine protease